MIKCIYKDFGGEDTKMFKYYVYYALGKVRRQYFMQLPENESEYQISRKWFVVEGAAASSIGILIGGAFLASLLQALEISDTLNGIITSLASVVCMAQFFGVYWAKRMKKIKLFVCLFAFMHRLIFTLIYFIPFVPIDTSLKVPLFIGMYLMAHILGQIIGPSAGNWIASLNEGKKGSYFARRDIVMVSTSVMTSLIAGQVFDYCDAKGETLTGFLIVGGIMLTLTIVNFTALSMVKEPKVSYLSRNNLEMHGKLVKKRAGEEIRQVHIEDESLDFIICMFAKIIPEEKMRTLKKGGKLIIVSTGEDHLLQLKEVVYESVRKEFYSPVEDLKIFKHLDTINVKYETEILEKESIENLFNMTPYRCRSPQKVIEKLFALNTLKTTIEINIDIFEKN